MPSPFPGMDTYIEAYGEWGDFGGCFSTYCCDALNAVLPEAYAAKVASRLKLVRPDDAVERRVCPGPTIHPYPKSDASSPRGAGAAAAVEPRTLTLPMDYDEIRESSVQILRYPDRRLVIHIELLSPTKKHNPGHGEYLAKHTALIHQQKVNMVEIDLLLAGERLETIEPLPAEDYYAFVTRANRLPQVDVYAWGVRHALPSIPVPLLPPDADVPIDLALLVKQVYDRGRYGRLLPYDKPAPASLAEADRAWAEELAGKARA